ncbi:RuvC family protein [Macrococcus capreoli]|uniref:hypothetical protein n=1 Tax=Macrococcus capreoli TaxID=2982690 RepID=UPI0021D5B9C0|nr:hypothetical protein [Macrococcus sp. TMW 2.2395]MCU7556574.1 hypothetical protein [Macrococcus sp. TMW 2.2395]
MSETYLGLDLSYSKSGWCVIEVKDGVPSIKAAGLIKSDTNKPSERRIDDTVTEIKYIASKTNPKALIKEASIIRQVSSATPVIKTHAVYEHELAAYYPLHDVSNSTVKAWARTVLGADGTRKDKAMIAEAVERYYERKINEIWTPRGKLLDDVADAIALATLWLEREGVIQTKYKRN